MHLFIAWNYEFKSHQERVPDEEDGRVISNQIPVAFLSVELHCETSRISSSVSRTTLAACQNENENIFSNDVIDVLRASCDCVASGLASCQLYVPTVENRRKTGDFLPIVSKTFALQYFEMS